MFTELLFKYPNNTYHLKNFHFGGILAIKNEIMPLALLRPISGSASMAVATDIMSNYGVDSKIRFDCIYYYGVNRNNFLYNCNIHKLRKN